MPVRTNKTAELDGRRAIGVARAAHRYDITKNTMRKILREAGVLIEIGKVHRVLWDDLLSVMERGLTIPALAQPKHATAEVSNVDRAAFVRASRGTRRT
jgi:hypothetical protein